MDFVPEPVRELLAHRWRGATADHAEQIAAYEAGWRRLDPAYYYLRNGGPAACAFTFAEARELAQAGAFGCGARFVGDTLVVNEHASHSLDAFLTECGEAWERHRDRLRRLVVDARGVSHA
jgi:hypothetical protein